MEEKKGYLRVHSGAIPKEEHVKEWHDNGTYTPTDKFLALLYDQTAELREPIITFINEEISNDWAVYFKPFSDDVFDVLIYCGSGEDYDRIVRIIKEHLSNKKLREFYRHPFSDTGIQ